MTLKTIGKIQPKTIYHVRFTSKGIEKTKCTSTSNYMKDAEKFASQFKNVKIVVVTMEILCDLGIEYQEK